jgi:hypothetical protein
MLTERGRGAAADDWDPSWVDLDGGGLVLAVHDLATHPREADRGMHMAILGLVVLAEFGLTA